MKSSTEKSVQEARNYTSAAIDEFLALENPAITARTANRMILAVRIADAMLEKGINKKALAAKLGQHPSAVTKWLSGQHNFTTDTLTDIGRALDISFFTQESSQKPTVFEYKGHWSSPMKPILNDIFPLKPVSNALVLLQNKSMAYS